MSNTPREGAPERIWLQDGCGDPDAPFPALSEYLTWCDTSIEEDDTGYIRLDLHEAELAALREQLAALHQDASSKWAFLEWRDRAEKTEADNADLRVQLKDCSAAFDKQQEMLERNAEQIATLRGTITHLRAELEKKTWFSAYEKKEWVGLTDKEIAEIYNQDRLIYKPLEFYRAVEAKLKEKNGG